MKKERRRHDRLPVGCVVDINWKARFGADAFAKSNVLDVSESGFRIQTTDRMEVGSLVTLRADKITLHGSGAIRSCRREGTKYVVGIEFSGGLKWKDETK